MSTATTMLTITVMAIHGTCADNDRNKYAIMMHEEVIMNLA